MSSVYFVHESAGRCERGRQRVRDLFSSQTVPNLEQTYRATDVGRAVIKNNQHFDERLRLNSKPSLSQ